MPPTAPSCSTGWPPWAWRRRRPTVPSTCGCRWPIIRWRAPPAGARRCAPAGSTSWAWPPPPASTSIPSGARTTCASPSPAPPTTWSRPSAACRAGWPGPPRRRDRDSRRNDKTVPMDIGVVFPQTEIGPGPDGIRRYGGTVEQLGFTHVAVYDHVLGADPEVHRGWRGPYDLRTTFHE